MNVMDNGSALGAGEREWPEWTKHPMNGKESDEQEANLKPVRDDPKHSDS